MYIYIPSLLDILPTTHHPIHPSKQLITTQYYKHTEYSESTKGGTEVQSRGDQEVFLRRKNLHIFLLDFNILSNFPFYLGTYFS